MNFQPPPDLSPFEILFEQSEPNSILPVGVTRFLGNIGFPPPPDDRPWVFANFVQSIDGIVSFGGEHPGGEWISRSRHDRWMMDLLRAHADALICGARSLMLEAQHGKFSGGPVFRIVDPELLRLREEVLGRGKLKNIIVTGAGAFRPSDYRLFHSEHVEAVIATTPEGRIQLSDTRSAQVIVTGRGNEVDWSDLLRILQEQYGVRYLLCEGGPMLYGSMVRAGFMDEKFLTISPQEVGAGFPVPREAAQQQKETGAPLRLTSFTGAGFTPDQARWYRWISSRKAGDHEFNRYRAIREFAQADPHTPSQLS